MMITAYENKAIGTHHQKVMGEPPLIPGKTFLQRAFKSDDGTPLNIALALGYVVTEHPWPGYGLRRAVPSEAIGEILAVMQRWREEHSESKLITPNHVSCKALDAFLHFNTALIAERIGCPVLKPTSSESFILLDDIALVVAAMRRSPQPHPHGARLEEGVEGQVVTWVREKGLAGLTAIEIRRQRRIAHYNI
jgi:hypothetical protein